MTNKADDQGDLLELIMASQEKLNTSVIRKLKYAHYNDLYSEAGDFLRREWVDKFASALMDEVCETRKAANQYSKWWKNSTKPMDGVKEEIIDCLFFTLAMALASGMDAKEVYNKYMEKSKKNSERKDWDTNK
jgi:NTP pyrophosphatase (non-canonical NTP hydrolase)